jgi:DNA-binding LacI/PurR family transcriptional regulator
MLSQWLQPRREVAVARITLRKSARLADVAEAAGVSKATASNVFNRPEVVRDEVRERVLAAAKASGYRGPDPKGRLLSAGRVNAIGVATVEPLAYFFEDPFARVLMTGITDACEAEGVGVSLVSAASEDDLAWNVRSALVDGLILFCLVGADRLIASSRERRLPFVALAFGEADETVPVVGIDDAEGARLAARHLAELGHRRFAVLAMEFAAEGFGRATPERVAAATYLSSRHRVEGYFDALREFGIDTESVPIFETWGDEATVHAALAEIFAPAPPTAILAQSDRIAMIALRWLQARKVEVPGAVSVVGFDGVPESAGAVPPLTTVQQPIAEIGRRAVRVILEHGDEVCRETLPVELVVRGSTCPPPEMG